MSACLVATLGAQPQVIPLATQLLLHQGVDLAAVIVLHTHADKSPIAEAALAVADAFAAQPGWPPLRLAAADVADVLTPVQIDAYANALYALLQRQIAAGHAIHLLLAGGRKPMAMLGMSIAQLLFGPDDHVWYLHSDDDLRNSGRMLLDGRDQAGLVEVPLAQFSTAPPRFTRSFVAPTPAAAHDLVAQERAARLRYFVNQELTPAERDIARLLAQDVLTTKEIAARLVKSSKTVTNQLTLIYHKLENALGLQPDLGVKREFLRRELGAYLVEDSHKDRS